MQYLFVAIGFPCLLCCCYVRRRRKAAFGKYISTVVSWIYFEIKLAALILAVYLVSGLVKNRREVFNICILPRSPVFYILSCNARYAPRSFFKKSLFYDLFKFLKSIYDDVVPVMPLQVKLRKQILAMFIYGFVLPIVLFFVCDALFGLSAVRIMIPFYILYFGFISALFLRKYTLLVNDISELTRFSSALPIGDRIRALG